MTPEEIRVKAEESRAAFAAGDYLAAHLALTAMKDAHPDVAFAQESDGRIVVEKFEPHPKMEGHTVRTTTPAGE